MKKLCLPLLLLLSIASPAKNIVCNSGFESKGQTEYLGLGFDYFQFFSVDHWIAPTMGTSDYFFKSQWGFNIDPNDYGGMVQPSEGIAFAGIIPWVKGREYREYLQGELTELPQKGKTYRFSMKISTGNLCSEMVEELGVYFSAKRIVNKNTKFTIDYLPQVNIDLSALNASPEKWTIVTGTFVADGTEKYFTLGNFKEDSATVLHSREGISNPMNWCYYYIDEVQLEELNNVSVVNNTVPVADKSVSLANQVAPGKKLVSQNIYFETDKAVLKAEAYPQLYLILAEIKKHPGMKIEICGYTDSTGTALHNQQLSEARAQAVADFLTSNGIPKANVKFKGEGEKNPLSNSDNALNRRVEFIFSE